MIPLLEHQGYTARITFDAEDGVFVGRVLGIADSISFHGERIDDLPAAFRAAVDHYLADRQAIARAAGEKGLQPSH